MTQRERFEEWARDKHDLRLDKNGDYRNRCAFQAWDAWQAACPEGWQAVPKEATPDMQEIQTLGNKVIAVRRWRDTLAVAPKPGDV